MVVTRLRGALGFLTRLPVGRDETAWTAFRDSPWAFPVAGYVVGALLAVPMLPAGLGAPAPTVALGYLLGVFSVTGVNHLDGVADVADAAAVHGDADDRRAVLKDTTVGVGGVAAVGVALIGLGLGALGAARLPVRTAVGVVVAAEVGAKTGMAAVACVGSATHAGLGSAFTERATVRELRPVAAAALPAVAVAVARPSAPAVSALLGALGGALVVLWYVRRLLGGVSGDAFGAVNEAGRIAGLHAGVVSWTLW